MAQPGSDIQLARRGVALHVPFAARACWRWRWLGGCQKYRRARGKSNPPGALRIPGSLLQPPGSRDACVVRGLMCVGPWRYGILLGPKILKSVQRHCRCPHCRAALYGIPFCYRFILPSGIFNLAHIPQSSGYKS